MFGKLAAFLVLGISVVVAGCAFIPWLGGPAGPAVETTTPARGTRTEPVTDAAAKLFAASPTRASIYVYRNESMGPTFNHAVALDGKPLGELAANTYLLLSLHPGRHTLASPTQPDTPLTIETEGGKNYFVWLEVKIGFLAPRSKLQVVNDTQGKLGVLECNLTSFVNE